MAEGIGNGLLAAANLIDLGNPAFNVNTGFQGAKHLIAGTKNTIEKVKLFSQQLIDTLISCVFLIQEVNHYHIMFLAVAMAAADPLFDPLGVPGEIVVDHQRAELKIHSLCCSFRGDQNRGAVAKFFDDRRFDIHRLASRDDIFSFMAFQPLLIDQLGSVILIGTIENDNFPFIAR